MSDWKRWRGLAALVKDAVEHGLRAVERVHLETARRPFAVLELIPGVAEPTRVVHVIHDATVSGVHAIVRVVNGAVGAAVNVALDVAEQHAELVEKPKEGQGS